MSYAHTKTPEANRDLWETPQWLFNALNDRFCFDVDLACNFENCKAEKGIYFDRYDSLNENWCDFGRVGFCNPPYSDVAAWIRKAAIEREKGFKSILLIPVPNGDLYQGLYGLASEVWFINGRISFVAANDFEKKLKNGKVKLIKKGDEIGGNNRGTCFLVFDPMAKLFEPVKLRFIGREVLRND